MKKSFPLLFTLLLSTFLANAQQKATENTSKVYVAASYGWALPQGNFASSDPPAAGYAKSGSNLTLHLGLTPAKNFALELDYFHARYGVENSPVSGNGLYLDNWKYSGITFGPAFKIPMGARFEGNIKIAAGVAWVKSAVPNNNNNVVTDVKSSTFVLKPGVDLRYHITQRVFVIGNLDYVYMGPKFKYTGGLDIDQQISSFHLGFGLGVSF